MRQIFLFFLVILAISSALILRSYLVSSEMDGYTLLRLGTTSLNLKYTINIGVNFGLAGEASQSRQFLLASLAMIISIGLLIWGILARNNWITTALGLLSGGGLSNAYERVAYGGVFDYFNVSTPIVPNPFSFNLADIYIFVGFILLIITQGSKRDSADANVQSFKLYSIIRYVSNIGLMLCLMVTCIYFSWQILSGTNFLYGYIYERNDLEAHIQLYAPQNKNKQHFELTTRGERVRIFGAISTAVNSQGEGLEKITYTFNNGSESVPFLIKAELDHLKDVSQLVSKLKSTGLLITGFMIIFYGFCFYFMVSRERYFWRPPTIIASFIYLSFVAVIAAAATLLIGAQRIFYLLHEVAFSGKAQWFFYYQDSLMTTLMPEIVFADISIMIGMLATVIWLSLNWLLRRVLI